MKLKAYHSILIFAILVMSAAFSSVSNYRKAQYAIVQDMNKALALTLQENKYQWITPDTIQSYRSHLSIDLLKSTSNLCYVMEDRRRGKNNFQLVNSANLLSSKEMLLNEHSIQSYANCSMADVLSMSNQRTSLTLTLMAMIWAIASLYYHRRKQPWNHDADMFGTHVLFSRRGFLLQSGKRTSHQVYSDAAPTDATLLQQYASSTLQTGDL